MATLQELQFYLNDLLPNPLTPDFCPNGLQVEGAAQISKVATAVSASVATIEEAVRLGVQALVVHHGIFWRNDDLVVKGVKRKKLALLIENNISLLAYHLPLDAHPEIGNNWKAAIDMGWQDLQPFDEIGVKGRVSLSREEFQARLENYYKHPAAVALGGKERIETAALISGGAYRSLALAAAEGVDCFVTGNFDEPAWSTALEEKINFYACGHTATERVGPIALGRAIQERFVLECPFIDTPNPF